MSQELLEEYVRIINERFNKSLSVNQLTRFKFFNRALRGLSYLSYSEKIDGVKDLGWVIGRMKDLGHVYCDMVEEAKEILESERRLEHKIEKYFLDEEKGVSGFEVTVKDEGLNDDS
jgi:hypothetical protein